MKAFIHGFGCFFRGMGFSITRFSPWFLVPLILWFILVFSLTFQLSDFLLPYLFEFIEYLTGIDLTQNTTLTNWREILKFGFQWGLIVVVYVFLWYVLSRYMKYVVLIILSPLFAYLSERTEEILTGNNYPFEFKQLVKDSFRGAGIAMRNLLIETFFILVCTIISFIFPIVSPFTLVFLFMVNSYFMAFNFFDYVAERKRLNISESIRYMRANSYTLLGFGVAYNLVSLVPFLDWVLAPISAASGAVIADAELPDGKNSFSFKQNLLPGSNETPKLLNQD
jgi:CysZ protein